MIKKEFYTTRNDGVNLYRTYSDAGLRLRKVGTEEVYDEAIDIENCGFEYEETDKLVEVEDNSGDITDAEFIEMVEEILLT